MQKLWPSPAKLNLFLHVTGRREDGYHELQTVFQILDYGDELEFSHIADDQIHLRCDGVEIETEHNLVYKAAQLLKKISGSRQGHSNCTQKSSPYGGEGWVAAVQMRATTLVALNEIWGGARIFITTNCRDWLTTRCGYTCLCFRKIGPGVKVWVKY